MGLPRSTYYDAPVATADEAEIVARIEAIWCARRTGRR